MEARARAVLDEAWRSGVRYFDAARSYGRAEEFLGGWLAARAIAPEAVTVGSKWGYTYTGGWRVDADTHEVKEHSRAVLARQWLETRRHLGEHLALYQVHSVTLESPVLEEDALMRDVAALREHGIRLGLSTSGPEQARVVELASRLRVDGVRLFDTVQVTWNLLERAASDALAEAHAAGLGVIVKEALANGRLTGSNDDPSFSQARSLLGSQARRLGTSVDALAIAAALAQPWADLVLSGAVDIDQLRSNLRALEVSWDDEANERLDALVESSEEYWELRSELSWN